MSSDGDDVPGLRARIEELGGRLDEFQQGMHEFVALLAHELRTPLGAILMWAHVLRIGRPGDRETALDAIETSARAQSELIGGALDLTRALVGRLRIDRLSVDLAKTVRQAVDELRPAAAEVQAQLNLSIVGEPVGVTGDARRLHDVASFLLKNAIQATPVGGTIDVQVAVIDGAACIVVRDRGPGLSIDALAGIFTPFRPGGEPEARRPGGLGIELPLARLLAELHGGSLSAQSGGKGQGCTFTLFIPTERAPQPP